MFTKLGDDVFGKDTVENFRTNGVCMDHVHVAKGVSSGRMRECVYVCVSCARMYIYIYVCVCVCMWVCVCVCVCVGGGFSKILRTIASLVLMCVGVLLRRRTDHSGQGRK
jgi:hypothetical protein